MLTSQTVISLQKDELYGKPLCHSIYVIMETWRPNKKATFKISALKTI